MSKKLRRGWFYLSLTVVFEVLATLALRASDGFTVLIPSAIAIVSYAATVVLLAWALQSIPMSLAYVVWTAAGTAGVVLFSIVLFGDRMTPLAWAGIVLVIGGGRDDQCVPRSWEREGAGDWWHGKRTPRTILNAANASSTRP